MATTVVMPQMGYDMKEGTLVRWLKREGEEVKRGEPIAEIETDKAVVEMEAYASGVLLKTVVAEGATVPVGQAIAFIGSPGEPLPEMVRAPTEAEASEGAAAQPEAARLSGVSVARGQVRASPLARRLAEEKGIDLAQVPGTGPGGRITREDVLACETRMREAVVAAPTVEAAPAPSEGEVVPLSRMRQAIARRTAQSKREAPHFYVTADVDMTLAMTLRQQLNETLGGEVHVSVNDLIVKACALALEKYPTFNATFQGDHLRINSEINMGIAVAVGQGLIVASLGECRGRSLVNISRAAKEVVERAQRGVMREEEYTGSTFSISNMGMFDVDSFTAIIYPPQAAVLAVGTVRKQPVVRNDQITIAQVMRATLSTDHRVADGAQAAQFLVEVKRLLESPVNLLE
ncbi:MAG: 2-oxo acid dehydrogenase subunit E2 [Chloroflexi bacterium]|nr:2-oxo acid dehydrogenase subunit E2 [Chloroflexota bacterium]